jgi:hypothetical protein
MSPVNVPDGFWSHLPGWMWPIILAGILGFFLNWAIKASETVAGHFGRFGRAIHHRANAPHRVAQRIEHIEEVLERTSDNLECASTYLVLDAEYHHQEDVIIAENCPNVIKLLPKRMPFSDFARLWKTGWRPDNGFNT